MASATLYSPYASVAVFKPFQIIAVKRRWSDSWAIVPWITAQAGSDGTAKAASDMSFEWRWGDIIQPGTYLTDWYPWLNIAGEYIAIWPCDQYTQPMPFNLDLTAPMWVGIVDEHTISPFASATVSAGVQKFGAVGLKQALYQKPILGSFAECYAAVAKTDEVFTFNPQDPDNKKMTGMKWGNMSPTANVDGVYNFYSAPTSGADALQWTHARCIDYLLYYFCNGDNLGGGGYDGPHYYLSGPQSLYDDLDTLVGTFTCDESVGTALDTLINEKRGMSWRIRTNGGPSDPVFIDVFSFFEDTNPDWWVVDTFSNTLTPTITFDRTHSYDYVHVQGGPISMCGTWSPGYAEPTAMGYGYLPLWPQWAGTLETEYEAIATADDVADAQRGAERYKSVYQRFQVPTTWNWYLGDFNASPCPDDYAGAAAGVQAPQFMGSLRFQREIPMYETTDADAQPELRKAFVLAYATDSEGNGPYWHYVEKLSKAGRNAASLSLSDDSLGIIVEPHLPHVAALGTSAVANTVYEPEYSFYDYLFTGMIKTNSRLRCVMPVYNTTIPNEIPHVKVIEQKDAELILLAPLTVIDIDSTDPTALVRTATGPLATVFRDDSQRIIDNANLAARFYSQQQATARIVFQGIRYDYWPGCILDGVFTVEGYTALGTVVHQRQWNFDDNTTTITTGFYDIEVDKGKTARGNRYDEPQQWQPGMPVTVTPTVVQQVPVFETPVMWNRG
jgi:hypothetical protein